MIIQSLFPISCGDAYIDSLSIIIMFHRRNAYNIHPRGIPFYFYSYKTQYLDSHRLQLVRLVTYCYGYLKCYVLGARVANFYCVSIKNFT